MLASRRGQGAARGLHWGLMLTMPVVGHLEGARSVLLAGCGGGYDVMGAVPLIVALRRAGKQVHLASLSFTYLNGLDGARQEAGVPNLYEVGAGAATEGAYCPEAWLAHFLQDRLGGSWPVWCFDKTGVKPLRRAYQHLIERLSIDAIVVLDGGIDALLRGDETSLGTPAEDLVTLAALRRIDLPRVLACAGLGAEIRDGICHEQVLGRVAELTRLGGFQGAAPLLLGTPEGDLYRDAIEHVFAHQSTQRQSHVHKVILAAVRGEYGEIAPHVWLNPLLSFWWFFDLPAVTRSHLFLERLDESQTIWDAHQAIEAARYDVRVLPPSRVPF